MITFLFFIYLTSVVICVVAVGVGLITSGKAREGALDACMASGLFSLFLAFLMNVGV